MQLWQLLCIGALAWCGPSVLAARLHDSQGALLSRGKEQSSSRPLCASKEYACCGTIKQSLDCLAEKLVVTSSQARAFVQSQKEIIEEYYVFSSIARDPVSAAPEGPPPFNLSIYDGKVDMIGQLDKLMEEFKETSEKKVPFVPVLGRSNDIMVLSRDQHLRPFTVDTKKSALGGFFIYLANRNGTSFPTLPPGVGFRMLGDSSDPKMTITSQVFQGKVVNSINGSPPMKWIEELVDADVVPTWGTFFKSSPNSDTGMGYKGRGNRVANLLINAGKSLGSALAFYGIQCGDLSRLDKGPIKVRFTDGTATEWDWYVIGMPEAGLKMEPVPAMAALDEALEKFGLKSNHPSTNVATSSAMLETSSRVLGQDEPKPKEEHLTVGCPNNEYCVLKLDTFDTSEVSADEYISKFNSLAKLAREKGIDRLIFDVVANGGGVIPLGFLATKSLFREADDSYICDNFSSKLGPLAQFMVDQKWYGKPIGDQLNSMTDPEKTNQLANELAGNNCTDLQSKLWDKVESIYFALDKLYRALGPAKIEALFNDPNTRNAVAYVASLKPNMTQACLAGDIEMPLPPPEDAARVKTVAGMLRLMQNVFKQITLQLAFGVEFANLTALDVAGQTLNYTTPAHAGMCYSDSFGPEVAQRLEPSPFKNVLAVSDGMCGSTCGFFGLSSLFYSLSNQQAPHFRFVVYGGLGTAPSQQKLTPTVYHGANVVAAPVDQNAKMWGFFAAFAMLSYMSPVEVPRLNELPTRIPSFLEFSDWPAYSFRGGFSEMLGKGSLPTEYYLPLDSHYLSKWYYDTSMNGAGLSALYADAATFFPQKSG